MDFCRNVTVAAGEYNHHHHQEQLLSSPPHPAPPCSKLGASLDDLFPAQNTEVDMSLEWLSVFVEDCLSSTGNCLPVTPQTSVQNTISTRTPPPPPPTTQKPQQNLPPSPPPPPATLHKFVVPSRARTKRIRRATIAKTKVNPLTSWSSHLYLHNQNLNLTCSSDPPLLQQAYWLADSELIVTKREDNSDNNNSPISSGDSEEQKQELKEEELEMVATYKENLGGGGGGGGGGGQQQPRRCTHCLAQRTPQWRAGPLGPKTLCNACGVRYKSGRLLPEYRPAKSPTFVSYLHSNSHKKVMEMRMALLSSINSQ